VVRHLTHAWSGRDVKCAARHERAALSCAHVAYCPQAVGRSSSPLAATMRSLAFLALALALTSCGPFRPPSFDSTVLLSKNESQCVATLTGSWPNLPHDPSQWFVGGRTSLTVSVSAPSAVGSYDASRISVEYAWPSSRYSLKGLTGRVEFTPSTFIIALTQDLDGSTKKLEMNGTYAIRNPEGCG